MNIFLLISNTLNPDLITQNNTFHNILATYFGIIHMYSVFITIGIICAVFACFVRLKLKKISTEPLILSVFFIIPASLFGASFFGKINSSNSSFWLAEENGIKFWPLFAFWKAGMSIHGGVLFGVIVGLIFFGILSRKSKVSLWIYSDCIIPNILLGQVIGRWGNFFNHELLGSVTSYEKLYWLPAFIRDNLWQWRDGMSPEVNEFGEIVFRQPIFLYESFFNLLLWIIITFLIPILGQLFSKKPWKIDSKEYPFELKYSFIHFFNKKYVKSDKMTWKEVWDKAYFNYMPNQNKLDKMLKLILLKNKINSFNFIKKIFYNNSFELTKLNNSGGYSITRCGVQTGIYFFLWNLIRFVLETQREDLRTLFIKNFRVLDYTILILISVIGLVIAIYAQWGAPKKFRKNGFIYEKEYVNFYNLQTWKFENYLNNNIIIGEENYIDILPIIIKRKVMEFLGYKIELFEKYFELKYFQINKQNKNNNEIINYNLKIFALKNKYNKFFNYLVINQNFKFDLSKILQKTTLKLIKPKNNNYLILTRKQLILLLNNIVNTIEKMTEIKIIWNNIFKYINKQKTTIFNINFNEFITFEELKINIKAKKIKISKFKFKENKFYFFNKKVCFKLKWE